MTKTSATVDNGVNVGALLEAREALTEAPAAAKFEWRATCKWVNGMYKFFTSFRIYPKFSIIPRRGQRPIF